MVSQLAALQRFSLLSFPIVGNYVFFSVFALFLRSCAGFRVGRIQRLNGLCE
jgi:hypothetical protein